MRQKLGQHFLTNQTVLKKIAASILSSKEKNIIEIGPGHGELTQYLVETTNAHITCIERDTELAPALLKKFKTIDLIEGDALKILPELADKMGDAPYVLTGNIPYYLTGFLMRTIGNLENKPVRSIFTIQKEVAERLAEKPPRMNKFAAAVQFWAEPRIIGLISRKDFSPPPEVDSATIELTTLPSDPAEFQAYEGAIQTLFAQPRKTISNNLLAASGLSRQELEEKLNSLGISPLDRPQNLSIEDIKKISTILA